MISVGIDISKEKSTVCVLKPFGEVICKPFEIKHVTADLDSLDNMLKTFAGEIRIVMEATGVYHLPVLSYLLEKGYFVAVINPYMMKKYARDNSLRGAKTDKLDSKLIASYGIDKWHKLEKYKSCDSTYEELKFLGRQYRFYMDIHVRLLQELIHLLDYCMPGIKKLFETWNEYNNKDKLCDFVEEFWHFDLITALGREEFSAKYQNWAQKKGYRQSQEKANTVYDLASNGIPTLSSNTPSTKMLVQETVTVFRTANSSLFAILARMKELAKSLPEYSTVRSMGGVGEILAPKLIAEIGDIRKYHSAKALIASAGIDPPPYESGQYVGNHRKISKRGSSTLRKVGYEVMKVLKCHNPPKDSSVYYYILKKESEGKDKKLAKIAGLNKFLRIYYARVSEVYRE